MLDYLESLFRGLARVVRSLHPRYLRKFAADFPLYAPLAGRSLRRRSLRHLLIGLCLGAGIVVYLGLSASFHGAAVALAGRAEEMTLPADVLAFGIGAAANRRPDALKWVGQARSYEVFDRWQVVTSAGRLWATGFAPDSRLWPAAGGRGDLLAGQVLLPAAVGAAAGLEPGQTITVGLETPLGFCGREFPVAGFFDPTGELLDDAVVMRLDDLLALRAALAENAAVAGGTAVVPGGAAAAEPDAVAVWVRDKGDEARLLARVRDLFPKATLWWRGLPADRAYHAVGGFLSPGRLILALVFVLAGLGVFNVMLLSLLQRKTQLGVLKAFGVGDDEVFLLLLLEGLFTAAGGAVLGVAGGLALVSSLNRGSLVALLVTPSAVALALALALVSFYLAAWLPATLCRRASPVQLMAGRRLYLNPRSTCAQCGRCGGF